MKFSDIVGTIRTTNSFTLKVNNKKVKIPKGMGFNIYKWMGQGDAYIMYKGNAVSLDEFPRDANFETEM